METLNVKEENKEKRNEKHLSEVGHKESSSTPDKLQSRIKIKPYFWNYSQFLFNPTNYLKCDSRILDFSELCSVTLL